VWSAEGRDEQGVPVRDEGSVTYSAAIESAACLDTWLPTIFLKITKEKWNDDSANKRLDGGFRSGESQ
jgi:hypothetical protein